MSSKDMKNIVGDLLSVTNDRIEALAQLIKDHESSGAALKKAKPKAAKKAAKGGTPVEGGEEGGLDALHTGDVVSIAGLEEATAGLLIGDRAAGRIGVQEQSERQVGVLFPHSPSLHFFSSASGASVGGAEAAQPPLSTSHPYRPAAPTPFPFSLFVSTTPLPPFPSPKQPLVFTDFHFRLLPMLKYRQRGELDALLQVPLLDK